jgi:hypothetical protein
MKNKSLILNAQKKKIFMEHLELPRVMFVTGLIRMRKTSDTKVSPEKKLHNKLKRTVQAKRTRKMRRKKKHVQSSNIQK